MIVGPKKPWSALNRFSRSSSVRMTAAMVPSGCGSVTPPRQSLLIMAKHGNMIRNRSSSICHPSTHGVIVGEVRPGRRHVVAQEHTLWRRSNKALASRGDACGRVIANVPFHKLPIAPRFEFSQVAGDLGTSVEQ